jgi:predicted metal-dependent HD superfamily phosphohydrolase
MVMSVSPEKLDRLQSQWWNTLRATGVNAVAAYAAFDDLVLRYDEPHRYYHTLEHVAEMLRMVPRIAPAGTDLFAIQLAVWFHDAIYDPRSKTNEIDSGEYARTVLAGLGLPARPIIDLILSTDHRVALEHNSPIEFQILHDADLAILGASLDRYDRYAADIRKEYSYVLDDHYRDGRRRVLQHFLERTPTIYATQRMQEDGEAAARQNLTRELSALE